jgi:NAD(P)-dependent dehydrogenase (short-subunit alcohol dehydrogenase family)
MWSAVPGGWSAIPAASALGALTAVAVLALLGILRRRYHTVRRELVQLSSGAARTAYPGWSSYGAAKAAVDQWVRSVGEEQQRRGGVRVLSIAPGVVATGMQELIRTTDERDLPNVARFHELHDQGQLEDPDDVAVRLWRLLDEDDDASGSVLDLRRR